MTRNTSEIALLRAILLENCSSDDVASQYIAHARALGVDPLDYCAHRFGLGNSTAWERAARFAGFYFFQVIPKPPSGASLNVARLDLLGGIRSIRQLVLGREIVFCAPSFAQFISLAASRDDVLVRRTCIVPPEAVERALSETMGEALMDEARQRLTRHWAGITASVGLPKYARVSFALLLVALVALVMVAGTIGRTVLLPLAAVLLVGPGLIRLIAALPHAPTPKVRMLADDELPSYSVLIPLRDEAHMVPMLRRAMSAIDYPPEKLDIKFVVEERSVETVEAARAVLDDPRFRLVVVPDGPPRTKPKAVNYALPLARGAHLVIYDAEDVPEPSQLRLAASLFAADPGLACLQAELVPDNADENSLTALFAGEYAGLFGRLLPTLARWGLPVPLGGTSNHFRTAVLREIGGWDSYNVTEDADLGVRLRRRGLRAEPFASRTYEEAPPDLLVWMKQRTRWMKGWMQTYVVHSLDSRSLLRDFGWRVFAGFHVLIGGMILTALLHTVFLGVVLAELFVDGPAAFMPHDWGDWISVLVLTIGYGGAGAIVVSGLLHIRAPRLIWAQLLLPAYWLLHSVAAIRAVYELVEKPTYWAKTEHGLSRQKRGEMLLGRGTIVAPAAVRRRSG